MPEYYENIIKHYDLYKSYGEFNFLFEDTIQEYRMLTIAIVRISYEYYEEEDHEQNELPYNQQDRLLKGRKEFKTGKGYELRNFSFDTNMLEKINSDVQVLQQYLNGIRFMFYLEDQQKDNYAEELSYLKRMDFDVNFSVDK